MLISWMHGVDFVFFDEPNRDYFVSHHIVAYREFPLAGPPQGVYGNGVFKNSPVYNYFIALFLFFKDNFLFLQGVNVLLQVMGVGLAYLIGRSVFGSGTALLASLFFIGFADASGLTAYMWQPHAMLPFFLASVLLLLLAYQKRKDALLLVSIFFFVLAGAMHISVFATTPVFFVVSFLVAKEQGRGLLRALSLVFLTFFVSFFLLYFPVAVYQFFSRGSLLLSLIFSPESYVQSFPNFVARLSANSVVFLKALALGSKEWSLFFRVVFMSLAGLAIPLYLYQEKEFQKRGFIVSALGIFISMVAFASIFPRSFDYWEFFPGLALAFIVIAEIIFSLLTSLVLSRTLQAAFVVLTGIALFAGAGWRHILSWQTALVNAEQSIFLTQAMEKAIVRIKQKELFDDFHFFQLKVYEHRVRSQRYDAAYLAPLAKALDVKVTKIDDSVLGGYTYVNIDTYILLVCENFTDMLLCIDAFQKDTGNAYEFKDEVYAQPRRSVLIFKKTDALPALLIKNVVQS